MKKAKNIKKLRKSSKVTLVHRVALYGLTIIILTIYLLILSFFNIGFNIWAFLGAIIIAVIVFPILRGVLYPE
jgi:hypothetical protein